MLMLMPGVCSFLLLLLLVATAWRQWLLTVLPLLLLLVVWSPLHLLRSLPVCSCCLQV